MGTRSILPILIGLLALSGCDNGASVNRCTPPSAPAYKPVMANLPHYFPAELASTGEPNGGTCHPRLAPGTAEMFSAMLAELQEPIISTGSADALRFVWAGSGFGFVVVRIETRDGRQRLVARHRADGVAGPISSVDRALSSTEVAELDRLLGEDPFADATEAGQSGVDGSNWLLERMESGEYDLVERWTPEKARLREAGLYLAGLAGVKPADLY